jgi:hypothetical protein
MYAEVQDRRGLRGVAEGLMEARYAPSFQLIPRSFHQLLVQSFTQNTHMVFVALRFFTARRRYFVDLTSPRC